jgi:predicted aspartyl protease
MTAPRPAILPRPACFTVKHTGRVAVLSSDVTIFPAFAIGAPPQQGRIYKAIYDTGATNSSISPRVVTELGLPSIGAAQVNVGGGGLATTSHLVNIGLPNKVMFPMMRVAQIALHGGADVLIGMDILGTGDFAVTHHQGKTTFSFRVPSHDEIDFVAEIQKANTPVPAHSNKISRNSQCPCGSGKKFKKCCGA